MILLIPKLLFPLLSFYSFNKFSSFAYPFGTFRSKGDFFSFWLECWFVWRSSYQCCFIIWVWSIFFFNFLFLFILLIISNKFGILWRNRLCFSIIFLIFQNLQTGASLNWPASPGQHHALQLQGAGPVVSPTGHGRHHVRLPGICVWEGGRGDYVCDDVRCILVGYHNYDHGKIWMTIRIQLLVLYIWSFLEFYLYEDIFDTKSLIEAVF